MTTPRYFAARVRTRLTSVSLSLTHFGWLFALGVAGALAWHGARIQAQNGDRPTQLNGFMQQAQLTANDGQFSDHFGQAVAVSGDTILVGVPGDNVGVQSNQGSAFVYRRTGGVWAQEAQLFAPDGVGGDSFGRAVAISGDLAVIGTAFDDRPAGFNAGSVYVFRRTGVTWNLEQQIFPNDPADNDRFGDAVAVTSDTILVGAAMKNSSRGAAYVFRYASGVWTQEAQLLASDGVASDEFGSAVALQGDTALVGAAGKDSGKGAAYGFGRSGATWTQHPAITHASLAAGDRFGQSVAFYNGTGLIGAPKGLASDQGAAYVFTLSTGVWSFQAQLVASDGATGDDFGMSVALFADTALVGAPFDDVGGTPVINQGSSYVFTRAGVSWSQQENIIVANGVADDQAGLSVALDSQAAVLGVWLRDITVGPTTNADQGAAYIFNVGCPTITLNPFTLPAGAPSVFYSQSLTAGGGAAPYGFTLVAGALPSDITLSATGVLSGTTTQMGVFNFTVRATDANGCYLERAYSLTIGSCPLITFNPLILGPIPINQYYVQPIISDGGTSPYFLSLASGALPPGLSLSSGGVITGTPTAYGSYKFTIIATDTNGCSGTRSYTLTVTCPIIQLNPEFAPVATLGVFYQQTLTPQGGTAPYTFSLVGDLPPGVTLSNTGVLSGTPTALGTFNFAAIAVDATGCTVNYAYSLRVCHLIVISPEALPTGRVSELYPTVQFGATGGLAPYTFTLTGALPQGMSFNQGALSGTPAQTGTYPLTLQVTEADGCVGVQNYSLIINNAPPLLNLALNQPARQSSTVLNAPASRAVDGNTNGNWANNSVTHTGGDSQAWWQVDLGQVSNINTIKLWNRTDCCGNRLSNYYVFVSDVPFVSYHLAPTLNQAGVSSYYQASQAGSPTNLTINRTGRYVRVQLAGIDILSLAEVEVLGTATNTITNLALNQPAIQSSTALNAPASRAVDGNTNGNWANNSVTHTGGDAQAWWQVDLGRATIINTIKLWNRTDCCGNRLSNYYVFVSDVPFVSTHLAPTLNQAGVGIYYQGSQAGSPTSLPINRTGRYVRVQLVGTDILSLAEVEVLGTATNTITNLALNQSAIQSSTVLNAPASRAVDGNTNGNWANNSVTHTGGDSQAWWQVDLGQVSNINTIKLWNRTDCCGNRLSNYYVFVSDVPFVSTHLAPTLNQAGVSSYYQASQAGSPTNFTINRTGRYVRVQLAGIDILSLAEVEVLGISN